MSLEIFRDRQDLRRVQPHCVLCFPFPSCQLRSGRLQVLLETFDATAVAQAAFEEKPSSQKPVRGWVLLWILQPPMGRDTVCGAGAKPFRAFGVQFRCRAGSYIGTPPCGSRCWVLHIEGARGLSLRALQCIRLGLRERRLVDAM